MRILGATVKCLFDVRFFNLNTPSYRHSQHHELAKKSWPIKASKGNHVQGVELAYFTALDIPSSPEKIAFIKYLMSEYYSLFPYFL